MSTNIKFINRLQYYQDQKEKHIKRFNRTSNIRMLVFLIGAGITGFAFLKTEIPLWLFCLIFIPSSLLLFCVQASKDHKRTQ